ncbi:MAG: hypothetical protein COB83_12795 [Gammaproteobacteria bacterium]|nr:MAG: hypothetical protein COB83_12795 [Gammaproteobacteria bacterium]
MDKEYDLLFDGVNTLLDVSEKNEEDLKKLLIDIKKTSAYLEHAASDIHKKLKTEVKNSTNDISTSVAQDILARLNDANKMATEAAEKYKKAVAFSVTKVYGLFFVFSLVATTFIWLVFVKDIPTISEIQLLEKKRVNLLEDIKNLKSYGYVNTCGDKICIKIQKDECGWSIESENKNNKQPYCLVVSRS